MTYFKLYWKCVVSKTENALGISGSVYRHCWLSQAGFRVGRATGSWKLGIWVTAQHIACMHRTAPQREWGRSKGQNPCCLETSKWWASVARTTLTTIKAAPCSRQSISFRETGMGASLQMVPCQQFLAHSTLQQWQESSAALKKATGEASAGLTVLPRPSQEDDHEALSCDPPRVLKFTQGQDCPSDSYLKLVKVIHMSIAQTQHWHLCSANCIIHQWHLPMVYSRLQASINSGEYNIQRSTDSNKAVFVWVLQFQSRRLRRYSPTYQTRKHFRK